MMQEQQEEYGGLENLKLLTSKYLQIFVKIKVKKTNMLKKNNS